MTEKKETKTKKTSGVYIETVGRRKTSIARVRFFAKSDGGILINDKKLNEYFPTEELRGIVESPIKTAKMGKCEITVRLSGGGMHSQAEALRHGISRALILFNAELRGELKKARKAPQWSKR